MLLYKRIHREKRQWQSLVIPVGHYLEQGSLPEVGVHVQDLVDARHSAMFTEPGLVRAHSHTLAMCNKLFLLPCMPYFTLEVCLCEKVHISEEAYGVLQANNKGNSNSMR